MIKHFPRAIDVCVALTCSVAAAFVGSSSAAVQVSGSERIRPQLAANRIIVQVNDKALALVSGKDARRMPGLGLGIEQSVGMINSALATAGLLGAVELTPLRQLSTGGIVLRVSSPTVLGLDGILAALQISPLIAYAERDIIVKPQLTPNDPLFVQQWHYGNAPGGVGISAPLAWDKATGSDAVVAVVDTGILPHEDLVGQVLPGFDMIGDPDVAADGDGRDADATDPGDACQGYPSSWHGTHVAGTIAARTNNGVGVAGVAFGAKLVPVRALGVCGGYASDVIDGIVWAAGGSVPDVPDNPNPADVINLSLGGFGTCSQSERLAIDIARSLGAVVVAAAGNSNAEAGYESPGSCDKALTVGATGRTGARAFYSNVGKVVDIAAPGGDQSINVEDGVLSTLNTGTSGPQADSYAFYQGTSMATPHVAGIAALMAGTLKVDKDPSLTPGEIECTLKATARAFPTAVSNLGTGIADASNAINAVINGTTTEDCPASIVEEGVALPLTRTVSGEKGDQIRFITNGSIASTRDRLKLVDVALSGGSGDADLYVRRGGAPSFSAADCAPFLPGNEEACMIPMRPTAQKVRVMVHGWENFSDVQLTMKVRSFPITELASGATRAPLGGATGSTKYFRIAVPEGVSTLAISTTGGTGDADLFVLRGEVPLSRADCFGVSGGNDESCFFDAPDAGDYYVLISGFSQYGGLSLTATADPVDQAPTFSFPARTGVAKDALITSAPVTPAGFNATTVATLGGHASGQIQVIRDGAVAQPFTRDPVLVRPGDTIQVRVRSAAAGNTVRAVTVTMGGIARSFKVTTGP